MIARLTIVLGLWLFGFAAHADCRAERVLLRGDWGRAGFDVTVADNDKSRSRGLMHVESLAKFSGMLFVYDRPQQARFWMRNTLIPLDMIFAGPTGIVSHIHKGAIPHDETMIDGGSGILVVLEVNGGMVDRLGITLGSQMQHPAFGAGAIWPCE